MVFAARACSDFTPPEFGIKAKHASRSRAAEFVISLHRTPAKIWNQGKAMGSFYFVLCNHAPAGIWNQGKA